MFNYVIMEKDGTLRETDDIHEWARWFEEADRHIGNDYIGPFHISTVCLGIWTVSNDVNDDRMCLFETMVFGDKALIKALGDRSPENTNSIFGLFLGDNEFQRRYTTLEEARAGHAETVSLVRNFMAEQN